MAKSGTIKDLFPPGNTGKQVGAGRVTEDGTGIIYVFQTPDDVTAAGDLKENQTVVTFDNPNGKQATNVKENVDSSPHL